MSLLTVTGQGKGASPSSRRAWIEMQVGSLIISNPEVALLAEGVDRNTMTRSHPLYDSLVALLAEGVDRNTYPEAEKVRNSVALLAEGVDRNLKKVEK